MQKIKIAQKNIMLYEMAHMLIESAISFYGQKYAPIIYDAVNNSHLYEWSYQTEDIILIDTSIPKEKLKLYKNQKKVSMPIDLQWNI